MPYGRENKKLQQADGVVIGWQRDAVARCRPPYRSKPMSPVSVEMSDGDERTERKTKKVKDCLGCVEPADAREMGWEMERSSDQGDGALESGRAKSGCGGAPRAQSTRPLAWAGGTLSPSST